MKQRTEIASVDNLYSLKHESGLEEVVVRTHGFKFRGLLRYALKYALWAVRPGGTIVVVDSGPKAYRSEPYALPFSFVRQQVFKALGRETELTELNDTACRISLKRTSPLLGAGWSAGVLVTGETSELPLIERCLEGLRQQKELSAEAGGQIIVCGPPQAEGVVRGTPATEFLVYEDHGARAMITRKKNAIVSAARNPRVLVMHSRIVLQPHCISSLPREFDAITPRVEYQEAGRTFPYLDFLVEESLDGEALVRRQAPKNTYDRHRYLDLLRFGRPYIDGGLIAVRRSVAQAVPLSDQLAWGEAEDMEWSARLQAAGYLVDLEPAALATSQTFKLPRSMVEHPTLFRLGRSLSRLQRRFRGRFTHLYETALRMR